MEKIIIHKYAGILSAFGMAMADVVVESQAPMNVIYDQNKFERLRESFESQIAETSIPKLVKQGFARSNIEVELYLNLRYDKTDCSLMVPAFEFSKALESLTIDTDLLGSFEPNFAKKYQADFGFSLPDRDIIVDDVRVRAIGKTKIPTQGSEQKRAPESDGGHQLKSQKQVECVFKEGVVKTDVHLIEDVPKGCLIRGPSIIIDKLNTILVEPSCTACLDDSGNVVIKVLKQNPKDKCLKDLTNVDFVELSIFSHRFMSIAEQMGRVLQKTAISTNIKERLDFSCAMFGPDGGLVANAPHIPVHLGAMQVSLLKIY